MSFRVKIVTDKKTIFVERKDMSDYTPKEIVGMVEDVMKNKESIVLPNGITVNGNRVKSVGLIFGN